MKFLTKQVLKEYEAVKILAEADKFSGKTLTKEAYEDIKETKKRLFVAGEKRYFSRKKNGQDFDEAYHEKLFENVLDEREKTFALGNGLACVGVAATCAIPRRVGGNEIAFDCAFDFGRLGGVGAT